MSAFSAVLAEKQKQQQALLRACVEKAGLYCLLVCTAGSRFASFAPCLLTLDVGVRDVGDDTVDVGGGGGSGRANVAREGRQVRVAGVVKDVVLRRYDWESRERYGHLEPWFSSHGKSRSSRRGGHGDIAGCSTLLIKFPGRRGCNQGGINETRICRDARPDTPQKWT